MVISDIPAFAEFRLEPQENRVEQTELGTIIVASRVDGDGQWTATIRVLKQTGERFLGGGHRLLLEPLGHPKEPAVVARLIQGKVVVRDLFRVTHRVRFTPHSSGTQRVAGASRAAFRPGPRSARQGVEPRWYRAPDPAIRLRVEEDSTGTSLDVYVNDSSERNDVVLVLRGRKYRMSLQPHEGILHGTLQIGYQVGNDLYVGDAR